MLSVQNIASSNFHSHEIVWCYSIIKLILVFALNYCDHLFLRRHHVVLI